MRLYYYHRPRKPHSQQQQYEWNFPLSKAKDPIRAPHTIASLAHGFLGLTKVQVKRQTQTFWSQPPRIRKEKIYPRS
ncbi:hypothetical protein RSOLAG22IIIB_05689 [Rhizoctonia solani]|uniref:Uncharacterized protein n=1 Tax=Rhizoctonia solani TaxID=456999 RepID=A0A0K6G8E5_9AGAM|nr:hypothetical protein RSOLAG22IIIB_05689 [Rhizoctonia solani]